MDLEALRARLHESVDRMVDELVADPAFRAFAVARPFTEALEIGPPDEIGAFSYQWPVESEDYRSARAYRVSDRLDSHYVIVGRTMRKAWGTNRGRAVVFHAATDVDPPQKWYPWTEFVETDDGRYAATVPNPTRPRAILTESDPLPPHLFGQSVERSDSLFKSIREGASLRLVVSESDEDAMIRHGYWVARLRNRL